jgi:putative NADPH-quinone reductase
MKPFHQASDRLRWKKAIRLMIARRRGLTCHAAIRREALAGLKAAGHEVDLLDLYAGSFDPVLTQRRGGAITMSRRIAPGAKTRSTV